MVPVISVLKTIRWKVLVLALVSQLLVTSLVHLGIEAPKALGFLSLSQLKTEAFVPGLTRGLK